MKKLLGLILLAAVFSLQQAQAQNFEVPASYKFVTATDYNRYAQDVVAAANWLEKTPLNQQTAKRKAANKFLIEWLTGSPTVTVEIREYLGDLTEKNPELLGVFMAGYAKHKLLNPTVTDQHALNLAGVKSMLKVYRLGGAEKDKKLDKLAELEQKDKLRDWVADKLK